MSAMDSLLIFGAVAILGAAAAGGLEAGGVKIPRIASRTNRSLLGLAGLTLMAIGGWPWYQPVVWPTISITTERMKGLAAYDEGNDPLALMHFKAAAKADDPESQYHYGVMLWAGEGTPESEEGLLWIRKSAEAGFSLAQALLAAHYLAGHDLTQARKWGEKSVQDANAEGMVVLYAADLLEGDTKAALQHLRRAAELGHRDAQESLARVVVDSISTVKDIGRDPARLRDEAAYWLKRSAAQGSASSNCLLWATQILGSVNEAYIAAYTCVTQWKPSPKGTDDNLRKEYDAARAIIGLVSECTRVSETPSSGECDGTVGVWARQLGVSGVEALNAQVRARGATGCSKRRTRCISPEGTYRHGQLDWRTVKAT